MKNAHSLLAIGLVIGLCACGGDTWSFDADGRFWFFGGDPPEDPFNSDNDFQGTWTLDGDRIELMVEDRGQLMLQIALNTYRDGN